MRTVEKIDNQTVRVTDICQGCYEPFTKETLPTNAHRVKFHNKTCQHRNYRRRMKDAANEAKTNASVLQWETRYSV